MRLILDTNILIAALITRGTPPDQMYKAWRDGQFTLITSELQIEEIRRVTRRDGIRFRIHPAEAGRLVNDLRRLAATIENLPTGLNLFALTAAESEPILLTESLKGTWAQARSDDLEIQNVH